MCSIAACMQPRRTIMPTPTLDGLVSDMNAYPVTHLELRIVDVDPPGEKVNTSEEVEFKVEVHNHGPLDVGNLQLIITGLAGTTIAQNLPLWPSFEPSITTFPLPVIRGHGGSMATPGLPYKFKAPSAPRSTQDLVTVTVGGWNGLLDHILEGHSDPDPNVQAVYRDEVIGADDVIAL
jgi:hypothetical protein